MKQIILVIFSWIQILIFNVCLMMVAHGYVVNRTCGIGIMFADWRRLLRKKKPQTFAQSLRAQINYSFNIFFLQEGKCPICCDVTITWLHENTTNAASSFWPLTMNALLLMKNMKLWFRVLLPATSSWWGQVIGAGGFEAIVQTKLTINYHQLAS